MIKTLYVFTEESSAQIVFETILPKILPKNISFRVFPHQGKQDLEKALRSTVPSISKIPGSRILITRDQDNSSCIEVKSNINGIMAVSCNCYYLIRIVCKELEAWFLGDLYAVQSAYPRFKPEQYRTKVDFRNVDKITSPNEYLLKIIPEYSGRDYLPKLEASQSIAQFLDFEKNTSLSFKHTISAISKLIEK